MYRHILVPLNSEADAPAARHAFTLSRLLGGRVTLLLIPPTDDVGTAAPDALIARLAGEARRPPALATLTPAPDGSTPSAIARYAKQHGADLILMAALDGSGARHALAHEVATRAGIPVKLCPAAPTREAVPDRWRATISADD